MDKKHLIIMFAKAPQPGRVKTRLQPDFTPEQSAGLYGAFLLDLSERILSGSQGHAGWLSLAGEREHPVVAQIAQMGVEIVAQTGQSLGDRMADAIDAGLAAGYATVTLIGSDAPTLPTSLFEDAWRLLETHDAVFGPSFDGGFTLIGARCSLPTLRSPELPWSSELTLVATLQALTQDSFLSALTGFWYDVDEAKDVEFLARHLLGALETAEHGSLAPRTAAWLTEQGYGVSGKP